MTFLRIILITTLSFISSVVFLILVEHSFAVSSHPYLGILARVVFITVLLAALILRRKDIIIYFFLFCFPILRIGFYGIDLFIIFSFILGVLYWQEIWADLIQTRTFNNITWWLLFFACLAYTTYIASVKMEAVWKVIFIFSSILTYFVFRVYFKSIIEFYKVWTVVKWVLIFCMFISAYQLLFGIGSIQFFFGEYHPNTNMFGFARRIPSVFMDAQSAGQYFAVISLLLSGLATLRSGISLRIISFMAFACLVLAISRSATIGFFLAWIFILLFINRRRFLLWGVCLFMTFFLFQGPLFRYVIPSPIKDRFVSFEQEKSAKYRFDLWRRSFPIFLHNPFGVGLGPTNLYIAGSKVNARFNYLIEVGLADKSSTTFENSFLEILYSLGIVGFSFFIWIIWIHFLKLFQFVNTPQNIYAKVGIYFEGALLTWLIAASTSPLIFQNQAIIILILILVSIQFLQRNLTK